MKKRTRFAFTLTELMVVVIIIGMLVTFGIPSYEKAALKNRERRARVHLASINGANEIYRVRSLGNQYYPGSGLNLAGINAGLSVTLIDNDMTYSYTRSSPTTYTCTAAWTGNKPFTLRVNETAITATNPCCAAGTCPTLPGC